MASNMKNNCLTGRISFKYSKLQSTLKSSAALVSDHLISRREVKFMQKNYSNPFDAMIFSGKSRPVLPPIINKHRKSPSIQTIRSKDCSLQDKPPSRSLNPSRSEFLMPKIFKEPLCNKLRTRLNIPQYHDNCLKEIKDITTPSFSNTLIVTEKSRIVVNEKRINAKSNIISDANLYKTSEANEISFGVSSELESISIFIKRK